MRAHVRHLSLVFWVQNVLVSKFVTPVKVLGDRALGRYPVQTFSTATGPETDAGNLLKGGLSGIQKVDLIRRFSMKVSGPFVMLKDQLGIQMALCQATSFNRADDVRVNLLKPRHWPSSALAP